MSHFCVLVVTKEKPTNEVLTKVLQPYHEYECTGIVDQYVVPVDITEEALEEWKKATETKMIDPEGNQFDAYDNQFYRDPTQEESKLIGMATGCGNGVSWASHDWKDGKGYRTKIHFIPEGWKEERLPTEKTFAEFAEDWYGCDIVSEPPINQNYILVDSTNDVIKVIKFTNPNSKWDYWLVGGRYSDRLNLKSAPVDKFKGYNLANINLFLACLLMDLKGDIDPKIIREAYKKKIMEYHPDRGGCVELTKTLNRSYEYIKDYTGKAPETRDKILQIGTRNKTTDSAQIKDIDFDMMLAKRKEAGIEKWDDLEKEFKERSAELGWYRNFTDTLVFWHGTLNRLIPKVSEGTPLYKLIEDDVEASRLRNLLGAWNLDDFNGGVTTLNQFLQKPWYNTPLTMWAILHDDKWIENGKVGWWGMSSGETMTAEEWADYSWKYISELPTDHYLTIVDCHI